MLARGIADFERMADADEPVFFDRGIAELAGYFRLIGAPVPASAERAAENYRSSRIVFLTPPWREIYRQDAERRQDWAEAVRTFELVRDAYVKADYEPIEIPRDTVARRVSFVLAQVDAALPP
jgi:predicted ATPase